MDRRGDNLFGGDPRHQIAAGDDVRDGIERADLVEVDEVDLASVCAPFGGGDAGVDGTGVVRGGWDERQSVDYAKDIGQRTMYVVVIVAVTIMVVIMFVAMAIVVMVMMFVMIMMMVVMFMFVMVVVVDNLLLAVDADGEMRRRNAAAGDRLADKFDAGDAKGVQFVECGLQVWLEFKKGGGQHVACGTH